MSNIFLADLSNSERAELAALLVAAAENWSEFTDDPDKLADSRAAAAAADAITADRISRSVVLSADLAEGLRVMFECDVDEDNSAEQVDAHLFAELRYAPTEAEVEVAARVYAHREEFAEAKWPKYAETTARMLRAAAQVRDQA